MIADEYVACNAVAERIPPLPLQLCGEKLESHFDGGHSSMVEPQIVVLAVAGSSPVGHPFPLSAPHSLGAQVLAQRLLNSPA